MNQRFSSYPLSSLLSNSQILSSSSPLSSFCPPSSSYHPSRHPACHQTPTRHLSSSCLPSNFCPPTNFCPPSHFCPASCSRHPAPVYYLADAPLYLLPAIAVPWFVFLFMLVREVWRVKEVGSLGKVSLSEKAVPVRLSLSRQIPSRKVLSLCHQCGFSVVLLWRAPSYPKF